MSLLLDALKKAEKAKEEARGEKPRGADPAPSGLSLEPTPEESKRVMTRDKLPDISTPLDMGEDLAPKKPAADKPDAPTPSAPPSRSAPAAAPRARPAARAEAKTTPARDAAQRATAQKVFEAKQFKEPNPRLPFYVTVGVLGVFAIGTIVYFWIQLRPPSPLVNANPPRPSGEQAVEIAKAPDPSPGATPGTTPASGATTAIPGLPGTPASGPSAGTQPPSAPAAAKPAPTAPGAGALANPTAGAKPAVAPPGSGTRAAAPPTPAPATTVTEAPAPDHRRSTLRVGRRTSPRIHPGVAAGYAAYQAGDLEAAQREYREALRAEPRNIDALLGMAAIAVRAGQFADADATYRRVLQLDPRNAHAHAGMLALRNQQVDPVAAESSLKTMLAREPQADGLHFTLGNQYAQQGRWAEAQQAYFRALASDPANPDFAYNLAVSLDHLHQPKPALQHYRLALELAGTRGAGFDAEAVRTRIAQLAR